MEKMLHLSISLLQGYEMGTEWPNLSHDPGANCGYN